MNFDFGNVLVRAWQIPWKHKSILALLLLPMLLAFLFLPFFIIPIFSLNGNNGFVFTDIAGNVLILAFSIFTGVAWLFFYVLAIIFRSSAILGVVRAERNEGTLLFLELLRDAVQYFWRILGVTLILGLTVGLAFSVFFMVVFVLTMVTMGIASICLQPIMIFLTPFGPRGLDGLPGLVLEGSFDGKKIFYVTSINKTNRNIEKPSAQKTISYEEYSNLKYDAVLEMKKAQQENAAEIEQAKKQLPKK